MRKIVCIFLASLMLLGMGVCAQTDDKVILRVSGLGLMQGDENGDFRLDDLITRAEFCTIVLRMKEVADASVNQQKTQFTDVPEEYWASGIVAAAASMGIVNGMGDGTFEPESDVTYEEAVKMLVVALGYSVMAEEMGGYPLGYIATAGSLGITKSVKITQEAATRGDIAKLLYNALDVVPLERKYGEKGGYEKNQDNMTLYDILTKNQDMVRIRGVLAETEYTSLIEETPKAKAGYVKLDTLTGKSDAVVRYKTSLNLSQYVGCYMDGYAKLDEGEDIYEIKNLSVVDSRNTITAWDAEYTTMMSDQAVFEKDGNKKERISLSGDVKYVYNGRYVAVPASADKKTSYGQYRFVDNNGDDDADIVFVEQAESFIVDKVNEKNTTVYFANKEYFRGKNGFKFDYEEKDNQYEIVDTKGNAIPFTEIKAGDGISLIASRDETYVKAVISRNSVSGTISSILDDNIIGIDGTEYTLAKNAEGGNHLNPSVGDTAVYVLDMYGNIIGIDGNKTVSFQYGYAVAAGNSGGVNSEFEIRVVKSLEPEKEVKTVAGNEVISYYFQNDSIKTYQVASKVKFNEHSTAESNLSSAAISGKLIGFNLNANGEIKELNTYEPEIGSTSYTFNANIISFGGESVPRGYATDAQTVFVCVPKAAKDDEDYYVRVKLTDDSTSNKVYGVNAFPDPSKGEPETQPVNVLMIQGDMDASQPAPIQEDNDVCIVGKCIQTMGTIRDDAEQSVYEIEILNGETITTEVTKSSGAAYETAKKLRKGDLIRYVKDGFGRIVNIQQIASIQGLGNDYRDEIVTQSNEVGKYGLAYDVELDIFDYFNNQQVDSLKLCYDEGGSQVSQPLRIFHEDTPPVYLYERSTGWIYASAAEDIVTYNQVGASASKVFVLTRDNDPTAVVIIKD